METQGEGVTGKEHLAILWNEYKEQRDWQRHNETQRAQMTNLLLVISGALIAFSREGYGWPYAPMFVIFMGIFGLAVVAKYWERFIYHAQQEWAYRAAFDQYFPDKFSWPNKVGSSHLFLQVHEHGVREHKEHWKDGGFWRKWFDDERLHQHQLWFILFFIITLFGLAMLLWPARK